MCILKLFSESYSFKEFCESTSIPVYSVFDKGEFRNKDKKIRRSKENVVSFDVSDKEWDNFPEQVTDAINFLELHFSDLETLLKNSGITSACLDFPIYSRLSEEIINQNDYLPSKLISLAGKLGLGIGMSIYDKEALETCG